MTAKWRVRGLTDRKFGDWRSLSGELSVSLSGPLGKAGLSPRARDLLRVGATVHAIERGLPAAAGTNRPVEFQVRMRLEEPNRWPRKALEALGNLLAFQGDATWQWTMDSGARAASAIDLVRASSDARKIKCVTLFSGGLDSTSGIALSRDEAPRTQLVSHYSRQKTKQAKLAASLGYGPPSQARLQGLSGRGRAFYYRSFYFLTLAAGVASSYEVRRIVQFENGILAAAIPPSPAYFMTRHAHPTMHKLAEQLFSSVLGRDWSIENPFLGRTKGEVVSALVASLGERKANELIAETETCWYLYSNQLGAHRKKQPGTPCGVCIPCIVRRAALKRNEGEYDLGKTAVRSDWMLARDFDAYRIFARRAADLTTRQRLFLELPNYVRDLTRGPAAPLAREELLGLLHRFAIEFRDAFPGSY
jgi:7-cyano-7-deazaguanine synthase in queuosine biosynthesis